MQNLDALSRDELAALVAKYQAANKPKALTLKVGEKGGVCIYGMGRYPIHAYASQWERILEHADQIKAFIAANAATLARKDV